MPAVTSSRRSNRSRPSPSRSVPRAATPKLRRKIGPGAAILFKGSGFYQTDYRSDSYKKGAKADKPAESSAKPSESSSSTKAESPKPSTNGTSG